MSKTDHYKNLVTLQTVKVYHLAKHHIGALEWSYTSSPPIHLHKTSAWTILPPSTGTWCGTGFSLTRVPWCCGINEPTVPAYDGRRFLVITRNEKQQCSENTCPSGNLSTTNFAWVAMEINLDLRGQQPITTV